MKFAVLIGYFGENFAGSQFQTNKRTVEGEFIKAGIKSEIWPDAKSAHFRAAGRTDKGVSARNQLISVSTEYPIRFIERMNHYLPEDIWCKSYCEVDDSFHPRFQAGIRTYRYFFPYHLNIERMNEAAQLFVGTHDFGGFSKMEEGRDPLRTVTKAAVFPSPEGYPVFEVSAKSFLWNMVRGMAGLLETIGLELTDSSIILEQLSSHDGRVHPAPAEGLVFWDIETDLTFTPMWQKRKIPRNLYNEAEKARMKAFATESLIFTQEDMHEDAMHQRYGSFIPKDDE